MRYQVGDHNTARVEKATSYANLAPNTSVGGSLMLPPVRGRPVPVRESTDGPRKKIFDMYEDQTHFMTHQSPRYSPSSKYQGDFATQ